MNSYIHIPFCRQKCPYCKFALTPIFDDIKKRRYIEYLKKEIRDAAITPASIGTIYFWWGTPSVLTLEEVWEILLSFQENLQDDAEISFECNPEDITTPYLEWLVQLWINRVSLGIQSLNNETLKAIHRSDRESIFRALESIKNAKPGDNVSINIDFILGLPYSRPWDILAHIREIHEKYPSITHTSVYMLEDGLYPKEWKSDSLSEAEMETDYGEVCIYFEQLWWDHYEVSSWARRGYECQHNRGYWNHTNTRGFGLSATSYIDGVRWDNSHSFRGYFHGDIKNEEILTPEDKQLETIIHDLRTFRLDVSLFPQYLIEKLQTEWYIEVRAGKIILTSSWIFRENTILSRLVSPP